MVDVKIIPGGNTCTAAALGEGDGLALATNATTTLALMGGNNVPETVVALPEADTAVTNGERLRFVHAAPGTGPLNVGIAAAPALPTALTNRSSTTRSPTAEHCRPARRPSSPRPRCRTTATSRSRRSSGTSGRPRRATRPTMHSSFTNSATARRRTRCTPSASPGNGQYPLRAIVCPEDLKSDGTPAAPGKTPFTNRCAPSSLSTISVDIFNPALYGPNSPDWTLREPVVPAAIAGRDSDIMCLVEVDLGHRQKRHPPGRHVDERRRLPGNGSLRVRLLAHDEPHDADHEPEGSERQRAARSDDAAVLRAFPRRRSTPRSSAER